MKLVRSIAVAIFTSVIAMCMFHSASAAPEDITCGSFNNDQAAAQDYFDANGQPDFLDGDGDGQACASPEDGDFTSTGPSAGPSGPSAGPEDITCGHFNNDQAAAQEYFDANGQPYNLDGDGDGQACASPEDGDYTSTGPSAGPEDGDGTGEESSGSQDSAPSASSSTDTESGNDLVSELPATGSGPDLPTPLGMDIVFLMALGLTLGAGVLLGGRSVRR